MNIPYRITIEIDVNGAGKTIQLTGETPDRGFNVDAVDDAQLCALASDALGFQSAALKAASEPKTHDAMSRALNMPTSGRPN